MTLLFSIAVTGQQSPKGAGGPGYILGPGDQISVFVADLPDEFADKTFRIDTNGDVSLPIIGHLHAAGLTTSDLENSARQNLIHVLKNPQVNIAVSVFGSQSASVLGSVNQPGIHQLEGHKTLFEMLSASGGLRIDAGYSVTVTRNLQYGAIPLPQARTDQASHTSVASIKLKDIMTASKPAENIDIMPGDSISVPKADLVYAVGSVTKPGGFVMNEHETLSALQVVSLAEGTLKTAALSKAKILRATPGSTQRTEIAVNLKKLMAGKGDDIQLQPDDILFIPNSIGKVAGFQTIESVISLATGMAVYGRL